MERHLVTIEFRYNEVPKNSNSSVCKSKTITLGVFDSFDEAAIAGNKELEIFEKHFKLNPHYNTKERFSKNGGCFGTPKTLITNLAYLKTPFDFYFKIEKLKYEDVEQTILDVIEATNRYKKYKTSQIDD